MNKDILLKKIANELYSNGLYLNDLIKSLTLMMHNIQITYKNINYSIEPIITNIENMQKRFNDRAWQIKNMFHGTTTTFENQKNNDIIK
ncbi:MAG: hypothetical protein QXW48_04505 [Thermoplasmata archaeon]